MIEINTRLKKLEAAGTPIVVGLIGSGQMGREIIATIGEMKGMTVGVVVDLDAEIAKAGYRDDRANPTVAEASTPEHAQELWESGKHIATTDYRVATRMPAVDVVVDATGSVEMGAKVALDCMDHKKHIVMMSVECDITVGPALRRMAENAGVVYTLAAGDEPAAIVELYRFADSVGFEVVAAGKGKNNPLNHYADPDTEAEKAKARDMSARMLAEFVDGSKTAIEMCAVSNATGLTTDLRGMHGATSSIQTLKEVFVPEADGGVLRNKGVVDFAIGVHPGVFLVVTTDNARLRDGLGQRDMGKGPYYTLYRPYHLTSIEVPITVAVAAMYGESAGHPLGGLVTECIAISKKEIKAGETLDGIGEWCYRGSVDHASVAQEERLLPLGMAKGCKVIRDIPKDTVISYADVELPEDSVLVNLRKIQDQLYR